MEKTPFEVGFEKAAGRVGPFAKLIASDVGKVTPKHTSELAEAAGKAIKRDAKALAQGGVQQTEKAISKAVEESNPYIMSQPMKAFHGFERAKNYGSVIQK